MGNVTTIRKAPFAHHQTTVAIMLFIVELLVVSFVALLLLLMINRQEQLDNLVEKRTRQLRKEREKLSANNRPKNTFLGEPKP